MKTMIATLTFLLCTEALAASVRNVESGFSNLELRSCTSTGEKCVVIKSIQTVGSKIKQIHRLKNPTIEIMDTKTKHSEVLTAATGYLDLAENKVSLYQRNADVLSEVTLNLETLSVFKMEHK